MAHRNNNRPGLWIGLIAVLFLLTAPADAASPDTDEQLRLLQEQNTALQNQLRKQQEMIDQLGAEVSKIRESNEKHDADSSSENAPASSSTFSFGKIQLSGEAAAGFFWSGSAGMFPNAEFRVDEAKLFVEAPVIEDVYAFAEINLTTREQADVNLDLGEMYLDVENVSRWLGGPDDWLNLRIGRIDVPFGEEYLTRDAADNPLISHSLTDIWGVDEGIEIYGRYSKLNYVVAVQNGGISTTRDFTADKAVVGRIGYTPKKWLSLSASGMRTGDLSSSQDVLSEVWFANGWFRSLGGPGTTKFHANLAEGDIHVTLAKTHLKAFGGCVFYDDDDPLANNRREVYYYCVEAVQELPKKFYGAARFSQIFADKGFPLVGQGMRGTYLFGPLTTDLWLLTVGVGRNWNNHLTVKAEYSFTQGKEVGGDTRNHENLFATEVAFRF